MNVNYEKIKMLIDQCGETDCLEAVLSRIQAEVPSMGKDEAVLRLLAELAKEGEA
ncbi:MAG: hypothetical protein J7J91_00845 [Deltaproteobacteria bacterium]|nr:hypothetical protein [Deltaproteobacteria bacterium]